MKEVKSKPFYTLPQATRIAGGPGGVGSYCQEGHDAPGDCRDGWSAAVSKCNQGINASFVDCFQGVGDNQ